MVNVPIKLTVINAKNALAGNAVAEGVVPRIFLYFPTAFSSVKKKTVFRTFHWQLEYFSFVESTTESVVYAYAYMNVETLPFIWIRKS